MRRGNLYFLSYYRKYLIFYSKIYLCHQLLHQTILEIMLRSLIIYFLCIYTCICVYRSMEVYTLMCVSTCEGQMSALFLRHCPPYFLRQKLSLARNLPSRMNCLATKFQFSANFYFPTVEYGSIYPAYSHGF